MKIALITPEVHNHGGVPQYVSAMAKALASEHEVTVFSVILDGLEHHSINHRRVSALGTDGFIRSLTFASASSLTLLFLHLTKAERFDIIHTHGDYVALADVISSHFCEAAESHRLHHQKQDVRPGDRRQHRIMALLEKVVMNRYRGKPLIVPSERTKRDFIRHHRVPDSKTFVIQGGVDSQRYKPGNVALYRRDIRRRYSVEESTPLILFLAHAWDRKGLAKAIESMPSLKSHGTKLIVVGSGDRNKYLNLARLHGVEERVIFAGNTQEAWKYYAASDVFLLPTFHEPFGLVTLEAMATGIPVLVSRCSGAAETIQDGVNGLLIDDPTNTMDIVPKLERLLEDGHFRRRLGYNARKTASLYTWEHVAKKNLEVYSMILNRTDSGIH